MKEVVLITGAKGMLARHLAKTLSGDYSLRFLTRSPKQKNEFFWDIGAKYIDPEALKGVEHIIHLAGTSVADKRWTTKRKESIISSRIDSAGLILSELANQQLKIKTFISASATGYYGTTTSAAIFTEESPKGNDFLSDVCYEWENAAFEFETKNIASRTAVIRIGIILSKDGGALNKIVRPIKCGIGAGIGSGKQFVPWIHIDDLSKIFNFVLVNRHLNGVYNATSPEFATNKTLTASIARTVNRKIVLPNIPAFVIKGMFGQMAVVLLEGSRISSDRILKAGFKFEFDDLNTALANVLKPNE